MNIRPRAVGIYASAIARSEMYGIFMVLKLSQEQAIFMYVNNSVTLNFNLMTPKSNQIIVPPTCIHEPSLKLICQMVLKLSREQDIFMYFIEICDLEL